MKNLKKDLQHANNSVKIKYDKSGTLRIAKKNHKKKINVFNSDG